MKALTISQPFASLIASGEKWIENRTWFTNHRGPIAIHAGKGTQYLTKGQLAHVPHGCILATAELVSCVPMKSVREYSKHHEQKRQLVPYTSRSWYEVSEHFHAEGPFCWILENVVALPEPVQINGAQGLWEWNR